MVQKLKIQQVEELVGITKKNIRFYEHEGLLSPGRSENGYRDYSPEDVDTLKRIRLLRSLSFPLDEIRRMQNGTLTMEDGVRRHLVALERGQLSLEKAKALCLELQEHRESLQTLNVDLYLEKMNHMEKEGAVFMDVKKTDHRKEYIAPIVSAGVVILFLVSMLCLIACAVAEEHLSAGQLGLLVIAVVFLLMVVAGILLALRQRIRQIKGGEEDAAAKY